MLTGNFDIIADTYKLKIICATKLVLNQVILDKGLFDRA